MSENPEFKAPHGVMNVWIPCNTCKGQMVLCGIDIGGRTLHRCSNCAATKRTGTYGNVTILGKMPEHIAKPPKGESDE